MSLIGYETIERNPKPSDEEEVVYGNDDQAELVRHVKPEHLYVQILYRPHDPINTVTLDSMTTWAGNGIPVTRLADHFGGWINTTRNWQTRRALKRAGWRYLLLVDSDVAVHCHIPYLLARHDLPIVSGIVPCYNEDRGGMFLNIAIRDSNGSARFPSLGVTKTIPFRGVVECHNAGTGCLLVRRDVLERLWEMYEQDQNFGQPFELTLEEQRRAGETGAVPRGEDICFTDRARKAGFTVHADFEARCVHDKIFPLAWPQGAVADIDVKDWAVSVFDKTVRQL